MFFLGISAHLFIYLLVPALLIVCCYFRGIPGNSEVITLLPEATICEKQLKHISEKTYIYQIEKQEVLVQEKSGSVFEFVEIKLLCFDDLFYYLPPFISNSALRAPPVITL